MSLSFEMTFHDLHIVFYNWLFQLFWFVVSSKVTAWCFQIKQNVKHLISVSQVKEGLIPNVPIIRLCLTDCPPCTGQHTGFYAGQILWGLLSVPWWLWFGRQEVFSIFFDLAIQKWLFGILKVWEKCFGCENRKIAGWSSLWSDPDPSDVLFFTV